jgi:hypothetical protein
MGCTLNCCATSSASSSLFFFRCTSTPSSFRLLAARPLRFLLRCSSTSFERAISPCSRLFEKSTCYSDSSPRTSKSNSYSPSPSLPACARSSQNSLAFLMVARWCAYSSLHSYWSWVLYRGGFAGERAGALASCESLAVKRANLRACTCLSNLVRVIWRVSSMCDVTSASRFSVACSWCVFSSSLQRR